MDIWRTYVTTTHSTLSLLRNTHIPHHTGMLSTTWACSQIIFTSWKYAAVVTWCRRRRRCRQPTTPTSPCYNTCINRLIAHTRTGTSVTIMECQPTLLIVTNRKLNHNSQRYPIVVIYGLQYTTYNTNKWHCFIVKEKWSNVWLIDHT